MFTFRSSVQRCTMKWTNNWCVLNINWKLRRKYASVSDTLSPMNYDTSPSILITILFSSYSYFTRPSQWIGTNQPTFFPESILDTRYADAHLWLWSLGFEEEKQTEDYDRGNALLKKNSRLHVIRRKRNHIQKELNLTPTVNKAMEYRKRWQEQAKTDHQNWRTNTFLKQRNHTADQEANS